MLHRSIGNMRYPVKSATQIAMTNVDALPKATIALWDGPSGGARRRTRGHPKLYSDAISTLDALLSAAATAGRHEALVVQQEYPDNDLGTSPGEHNERGSGSITVTAERGAQGT
jgi:hypothetical protein